MNTYICTKMICAVPAKMVNGVPWPEGLPLPEETVSFQLACEQLGCVSAGDSHIEEGYVYTINSDDKYPQWMPKEEFEKICISTENMDFGNAITALKLGKRVARRGWNGKNQYVELATCVSYKNAAAEIVNVDHQNIGNKALAFVGTSGVQLGWLASQADMLANDWYIIYEEE